ncbi:hypothetical protein EVB81_238 [Rhizobium phage RHph_I46]|uniref:Uncharacterized protein n=1 Tax=Rhizobium phage RHph_I1_9 TaxID=2509729 RepID=A0A7S5UZR1_9CAUD|nr:hypothetical protein PP936_gp236 [Rhizobium phage RHph_I1_9]QIG69807.1 hypothetical protein EVB81_238 [Rhizobium phage RHph_I46]QIG71088.1 hypothetical protein EVB92_238 [Rhizobium phage RHph_I9]QIG73673.1 hypothetical protein EVC04_236 [Rhizobium phage RHph_I1_9]QIG76427.1 hypothetical protein EVC25_238 [Rhizobium phage RHph_I34]
MTATWLFTNGDTIVGVVSFAFVIWYQIFKGGNVIKGKK